VIGWAAETYRQQIASLWPQSSSLYSALGLKVNARGIDIVDPEDHVEKEDGQFVLVVTGRLVNITQARADRAAAQRRADRRRHARALSMELFARRIDAQTGRRRSVPHAAVEPACGREASANPFREYELMKAAPIPLFSRIRYRRARDRIGGHDRGGNAQTRYRGTHPCRRVRVCGGSPARAVATRARSAGRYFVAAQLRREPRKRRNVSMILGPNENARGKNVLVIDGVLDHGRTLVKARELYLAAGAASVTSVVAVDKSRKDAVLRADYTAFAGVSGFIVGYGMDDAGEGRGLPFIGVMA
jgi:hypoxanthine phosphoribosyltransferase